MSEVAALLIQLRALLEAGAEISTFASERWALRLTSGIADRAVATKLRDELQGDLDMLAISRDVGNGGRVLSVSVGYVLDTWKRIELASR